jgi:hypothetical protein
MQRAILDRQIDAVIAHLIKLVARGPGIVAVGLGLRFASACGKGPGICAVSGCFCDGDAQGG